jgi:hypothetical protein
MPFIGIGVGIGRQRFASGIFAAYAARVAADGGVTEAGACVDAVSALLQTASLLLVPSGYKSGVVYSEIPTNGDGDLTFTRASSATRVNSDGEIESVATGVPRLDYSQGSCPALLLEPQRTNLALYSEQFDDAYWTKVNTGVASAPVVTANAEISPDGTQNADRVVFTLNGGTASGDISQLESTGFVSVSLTRTQSVYIKTTDNTTKVFTFVTPTGATQAITVTGTYQRFRLTATGIAAGTLRLRLRGGEGTATSATIAIWGMQYEEGSYPTTYIPTTTATVTRIADAFSRNNIYTNNLITSSGGTWFVELRNNVAYTRDGLSTGLFIDSGSGSFTNGFNIRNGGGGNARFLITKWQSGAGAALYTTLNDITKIAIKWNGSTADVFANGTKVVSATSFTPTAMEFLNLTSGQVPYFIQQMALYPTPLSDSDCIALTTL